MSNEKIYQQFNEIDESVRILCVDAAAVACFLIQQGHEEAGKKLLHTAITAAGLTNSLIPMLLDNLPESLDALPMHVEIKNLLKKSL